MKTDTVIAFPDAHTETEAKPCRPQALRQLPAQFDTLPTRKAGASARGFSKPLVARPGPRQLTAEEHASFVASVIRISIRSAKRRGVRLESLLSIPRRWLLDLCEEGDPTCLLVLEWLTGAGKHLPSELQDLAATPAPFEQGGA
jgi:hypothetical protein